MSLPQCVFRCFKRLERFGDRVTGAAGPYFVGLAIILIGAAIVCCLDVVIFNLPWPWLTVPPCLLIIVNLATHYYLVCTTSPGFVDEPPPQPGSGILWAAKRDPRSQRHLTGVRWSPELHVTKASAVKCSKCGQTKPERAHHCRICNKCVLKYDHHCPVRVNQCVGLYNERHFVLFMAYLVIGSFWYSVLGWPYLIDALGLRLDSEWAYHVPAVLYMVMYMLSVVMCLAVGTMLAWHLWSVAQGETSVENHDHEHYRKVAKTRGETFVNSYDLGKWKNLKLFFNIGPEGYSWTTLVLPLRIQPYTDGRSWARRPGHDRHHGVRQGEELTDEEEDD
ncbi:zf-DHHC-domain-containing protein [Dentipellis sp. KUC8613]|nr:zf-DHHC-domain-containing protein [Dentipellis sp. KUC8613]